MKRSKTIVLILILSFSLLHLNSVLGNEISSCQPHDVCVHPGNYLKYNIALGQINSSETYSFGEMVDSNNIKVNETYSVGNKIENSTFILDLGTGYGHNYQKNSTVIPFLVVLPIPLQYNQSDISISKGLKNFNGFNRTVLSAAEMGNSGTLFMEYDIQTGILISAHSIGLTKQFGNSIPVEYSNDLVDTNIINSDSSVVKIAIPGWIKNTAEWWSSGAIDDASFVKAIQYLISNGIMQIPHGFSGNSSSQEIPAWIKNNAGWWAQGKISDDEFISGIQYLINSGIVKV
jgi:hypothetical protein